MHGARDLRGVFVAVLLNAQTIFETRYSQEDQIISVYADKIDQTGTDSPIERSEECGIGRHSYLLYPLRQPDTHYAVGDPAHL
jgi:hypothetical protein